MGGACRGGGATAVAKPIHLWRGRREKTDGRGQRREARNRGLHAPATFSLRFFAKWAEQKAEVRFLPFQCDENRK